MTEAVLTTSEPVRRIGARQIVAGAVVLALAGVVAYWFVAIRGYETTADAFVEGHMVFLSPRVSGQIAEVVVDENTRVREGQVLVRLDPSDYEVVVTTLYAVRASAIHVAQVMDDMMKRFGGRIDSGELVTREQSAGRLLSQAVYARWEK